MEKGLFDRELSVSEIFERSVSIYLSNITDFLIVYIGAAIIVGFFQAMLLSKGFLSIAEIQLEQTSIEAVLSLIAIAIVSSVLEAIVSFVRDGVAVKLTSDYLTMLRCDFQTALSFVLPKVPSIVVASFVAGLLTFFGFLFLIIPGIIVAIMFSLVLPVIVIEEKGAFESLGRSKALVSRRWIKTFIVIMLSSMIIFLVRLVANVILTPFEERVAIILAQVIAAIVSPIEAIALTLLYYSMLYKEKVTKRITSIPPPAQA